MAAALYRPANGLRCRLMSRSFDLLDGHWYASQPYEDWAWMRQHAPLYWDPVNEVWAMTRYHDIQAAERDPATYSSERAPRPHGDHLPMMISFDDPEHWRRRKLAASKPHPPSGAQP